MPGRLQDKVALVTGAGCVGQAGATAAPPPCCSRAKGAKVFAVDRDAEAMTETLARVAEFAARSSRTPAT
jgi:NADP-dependent 3-hydroxy acid dehydrogenase YdfG